mmetsp:Transcript_41938/g.111697  ORF Transcript_41938/g.111697 Transcript_41938/m.111697 type:complete len:105 (-) Transcript_41938:12-326(-)
MNSGHAQAAHIWVQQFIRNENQSPNPGMDMEVDTAIKPPSENVVKPAPTKPPRRLAASRNARNKAKDGQKEKRCGAGYQRKNGRWEGRFRPTVRAPSLPTCAWP